MERIKAKKLTGVAVLTALVVVLQTVLGGIQVGGVSLSFVLVPIALGGIMYGIGVGAFLGAVFALVVVIYGLTGAEAFTAMLLGEHFVLTVLTCLVKGVMAGVAAGVVFKLLKNNRRLGVYLASAVAPIANTGFFILGMLTMSGTIGSLAAESGTSTVYFLFITLAGVNFLVEFAVDVLVAPALYTVWKVATKDVY